MSEAQYCVWCDGGCSNSGTRQARGYASYCLEARTGRRQMVRLTDLPGVTTNNQAEYVALISALVDLRGRIERAGKSPRSYSVVVHTDSRLLVGQLTHGWKVKAANLRPLVDEAAALIQSFGRCDPSTVLGTGLVKVPRESFPTPVGPIHCSSLPIRLGVGGEGDHGGSPLQVLPQKPGRGPPFSSNSCKPGTYGPLWPNSPTTRS